MSTSLFGLRRCDAPACTYLHLPWPCKSPVGITARNVTCVQEANPFHTEAPFSQASPQPPHKTHRHRPHHLQGAVQRVCSETPARSKSPRALQLPRGVHRAEPSWDLRDAEYAVLQSFGLARTAASGEGPLGFDMDGPATPQHDACQLDLENVLTAPRPPQLDAPLAPWPPRNTPWAIGAAIPANARLEGELDKMFERRQRFAGRFDVLCRLRRRHGAQSVVQVRPRNPPPPQRARVHALQPPLHTHVR